MEKCVVYIGRSVPLATDHASDVVVFRHLKKLDLSGWRTCVFCPGDIGKTDLETEFDVLKPERRRAWWPPMRFGWSRKVWEFVWKAEARQHVKNSKATCIIAHLQGRAFDIAVDSAVALNLPIGVLVHDDFRNRREEQSLIRLLRRHHHAHFWCVTEGLKKIVQEMGATCASTLLPIPSSESQSHPLAQTERKVHSRKRIAIAGTLYETPKTLRAISKIAGEFGISLDIIPSPSSRPVVELGENVRVIEHFESAEACARHIADHCSALLVPYPLWDEPASNSRLLSLSFPSRVCEFSKLKMPIGVVASCGYEIARWCNQNLRSALLNNEKNLRNWLEAISTEDGWNKLARKVECASKAHFDPAKIHEDFEARLNSLCDRSNRDSGVF